MKGNYIVNSLIYAVKDFFNVSYKNFATIFVPAGIACNNLSGFPQEALYICEFS